MDDGALKRTLRRLLAWLRRPLPRVPFPLVEEDDDPPDDEQTEGGRGG